jgi:photosystem II stability/assembly factor-like uncharacterized protein
MANPTKSALLLLLLPLTLVLSSSAAFAAQWSVMNTGLHDANVRVLAIDPINPAIVYAGTSGGLYKTTAGGMEWANLNFNRLVYSLAIDFVNPSTLYVGTDSGPGIGDRVLFKSTNGGTTWSNRTSPSDYDFTLLVMDPRTPETLYIGSATRQAHTGSMFLKKTRNGGETWVELETSYTGIAVGCCTLAIDTTDPEIIYASGDLYSGTSLIGNGVIKSTDGGRTWTPTTLTNPIAWTGRSYDGIFVNLIAMDPKNSNKLYAAAFGYGSHSGFAGLLKSTDGANTWRPVHTGLLNIGNDSQITAIVIDPDDPNVVYAATGGYGVTNGRGVFKNLDGGGNWTVFNDGLGALNTRSLALAPGSPNVLYVATAAGVFKNVDDKPIITLNENGYCVGSPWKLTVSNSSPETSVRLIGTSNNRSWEIPNWRQTRQDGVWSESGVFAAATEGTHYLRVEVGGVLSNVVSFVVSNCRP